MEKYKICVDKGLPMVKEMIRLSAIAKEMEMSYTTLDNKLNRRMIREWSMKFSQRDIYLLNTSIQVIGEKLLQMHISYGDREKVIEQIKSLTPIVYMPFIYNNMGKKQQWYSNRMKKVGPNQKKMSFSEDDISQFNKAISNIANILLSIEITL